MALTDFLFNGSPPASTTTYGSSTSSMPAWYSDYTQGLISKANSVASSPYQNYTGTRLAEHTPFQTQAYNQTAQNASNWNDRLGFAGAQNTLGNLQGANSTAITPQAQGLYGQAFNLNPGNAAQPLYNQSAAATQSSQGPGYLAAQPYLNQQQQFLNPIYQNLERLSAEKLGGQEQAIRDQFIRGGSFGGSRMGAAQGAARRANLADLGAQQAGLANTAYTQAQQYGGADQQRQLQAASQLQGLGTAGANLQAQQQQFLTSTGKDLSTLNAADLQRRLDAAKTAGSLGQTQSDIGLKQAGALEAAGASQQQQAQRNYDLAYGDYQSQLRYPYEQISFLNNAVRGLQIPVQNQISQTGPASIYAPSGLQQIAGTVSSLSGLSGLR